MRKKPTKALLFSLHYFLLFSLLLFAQSLNTSHDDHQEEKEEEEVVIRRSMFPDDFLFGVSTSAYQIEGGYLEDGKGLNNWDVFTRVAGNVANGDNADVADDHYHRYMEDIENLQYLGVNAYRFSISWARILPKGRFGEVNPKGVMFYNKIIDHLLLKGIEPFVTINHNDIPQELEDKYMSWLSTQMQEEFVQFAKTCFEEFGDRVKNWVTINEPNLHAILTYLVGWFPPVRCSLPYGNCSVGNSDVEPLVAAHNMLLAHAKAVKLYREQFQPKQGGSTGITVHAFSYEPYRDDEFSRQAVDRAFAFNIAWIFDPLIYGEYPPLMREFHGKELPKFNEEEAKLVKGSVDFLGINHYSTFYAIDCFHHSTDCEPGDDHPIAGFVRTTAYRDGIPIGEKTGHDMMFVYPQGMEKIIDYVTARYPNTTIYVTENGYSPPEQQEMATNLQDFRRIKFHEAYLAALNQAMRKGAKVKGYFAWSLMDNFEWLKGYSITFGLYHVDRATLKRTPKLSAKWYADFLANKTHHDGANFPLNNVVVTNVVTPSC